jgi:hypothetical protein
VFSLVIFHVKEVFSIVVVCVSDEEGGKTGAVEVKSIVESNPICTPSIKYLSPINPHITARINEF